MRQSNDSFFAKGGSPNDGLWLSESVLMIISVLSDTVLTMVPWLCEFSSNDNR